MTTFREAFEKAGEDKIEQDVTFVLNQTHHNINDPGSRTYVKQCFMRSMQRSSVRGKGDVDSIKKTKLYRLALYIKEAKTYEEFCKMVKGKFGTMTPIKILKYYDLDWKFNDDFVIPDEPIIQTDSNKKHLSKDKQVELLEGKLNALQQNYDELVKIVEHFRQRVVGFNDALKELSVRCSVCKRDNAQQKTIDLPAGITININVGGQNH